MTENECNLIFEISLIFKGFFLNYVFVQATQIPLIAIYLAKTPPPLSQHCKFFLKPLHFSFFVGLSEIPASLPISENFLM